MAVCNINLWPGKIAVILLWHCTCDLPVENMPANPANYDKYQCCRLYCLHPACMPFRLLAGRVHKGTHIHDAKLREGPSYT
jgi:hypothetical protein